jgi:hypothetical protein
VQEKGVGCIDLTAVFAGGDDFRKTPAAIA